MKGCPVCSHMDAKTIDRFLCMPTGMSGKRGPRSLSPVFGVDRRAIAKHNRLCLTNERREQVLAALEGKRGGVAS